MKRKKGRKKEVKIEEDRKNHSMAERLTDRKTGRFISPFKSV